MSALTCVLLPLSNKITGPVNGTASPLHVNITGSGNGMNLTDYTVEMMLKRR